MKYKKILFIAPINTKGRYSGGIVTYATTILSDVFLITEALCLNHYQIV